MGPESQKTAESVEHSSVGDTNVATKFKSLNSLDLNGFQTSTGILPPRSRCLPARYREQLPKPPPPVSSAPRVSSLRRILLIVHNSIQTAFNSFGIARYYRD